MIGVLCYAVGGHLKTAVACNLAVQLFLQLVQALVQLGKSAADVLLVLGELLFTYLFIFTDLVESGFKLLYCFLEFVLKY